MSAPANAVSTIQITTSSFAEVSPEPLRLLERAGFRYRLNPHRRPLRRAETLELLTDCEGVVAGTEILDADILRQLPELRIISRCGTGLENVDLETAFELGIAVRNTPDALTDAVAELALAGILATLRSVVTGDREIRSGHWRKPMGRLLRGKTVGIVGLGRIGSALAGLLRPFDVEILGHDKKPDTDFAAKHQIELCPLDELLRRAEIVTLHLPLGPESRQLLNRERLESMRQGAILVNCSRGGLVDEGSLYRLLSEGRLGGAHLDTFESEPYEGPLRELPNVLLTPHIGSYAAESRALMELQSVQNLVDFFQERADG
jgi:D-3-phosphoglycerate dehydrogenase